MKGYRLYWNAKIGWIIDTPVPLSKQQIIRIAQYAIPRQIERWEALPSGQKKVELERAIQLLKRFEINQRLI